MKPYKTSFALAFFAGAAIAKPSFTVVGFGISEFSGTNNSYYTATYSGLEHSLGGTLNVSQTTSGTSFALSQTEYGSVSATYQGTVVWSPDSDDSTPPSSATVQIKESALGFADNRYSPSGNGYLSAYFQTYSTSSGTSKAYSNISSTFSGSGYLTANFTALDSETPWSRPPTASFYRQLFAHDESTNYTQIFSKSIVVSIAYNPTYNDYRGTFTYGASLMSAELTTMITGALRNPPPVTFLVSGGTLAVGMTKKAEIVSVN